MRVCVCAYFPFLDRFMCTCMDVCLQMHMYILSMFCYTVSAYAHAHRPICRRVYSNVTVWLTDWSVHSAGPGAAPRGLICMDMCGNQNKDQYYVLYHPMRQTERWWRQKKEAGIKSTGRKIKGTLHQFYTSKSLVTGTTQPVKTLV